jgi:hypothetical protein
MIKAKLFVPSGTLVQANGGDTLSPMQLGFCLLLPAFLVCSIPPSLNSEEVIVKDCALACWAPEASASKTPPASIKVRTMVISLL